MRGEVVVPPHGFLEWDINVPRGAIIDVVVNTYIDKNDSLKKVLVVLIFDEEAYSLYIQGIDLLIRKPHGNRMFVEAWGTSPSQFRVPHTDRWYIILDNQYWVSDKNVEKPVSINVSVLMPYIYLLYPGLLFLFLGLAILIRRKVLSNRKSMKENEKGDYENLTNFDLLRISIKTLNVLVLRPRNHHCNAIVPWSALYPTYPKSLTLRYLITLLEK